MAKIEKLETRRKLSVEQILATAIRQSAGRQLVLSPVEIAQTSQNSKVVMCLDEKGNFVLTVEEK